MLEKLGANRAEELGLIDNTGLEKFQVPYEYKKVIEKAPGTSRQYLGHVDICKTRTGRLIMAYPVGHGKGPIVMRISDDNGATWQEKTDTPESWQNSYETPTLYTLDFQDGQEVIILISGCPGWTKDENEPSGFNTSISKDNGESWTEFRNFYPELEVGRKHYTTVTMASLIQLHDAENKPIDKWLAVYHDSDYVNYKVYLTFADNGLDQWTRPEAYLANYRDSELHYEICEVCLIRDPHSTEILALGRTQAHNAPSVYFLSEDEGKTWSAPQETCLALTGERHKYCYDSASGKLVITFREILLNENNWAAGDWIAWVGSYEDILKSKADNVVGDYRLLLARDYAQNERGGDTGYAGIVETAAGELCMASYGHFDEQFSKTHKLPVREDLSYILQVKFNLQELETELGIDRD